MCEYEYKRGGWEEDKEKKCLHPNHKQSKFCVFHHPAVEGKKADFQRELEDLIEKIESDDTLRIYDFEGFVFPEITFEKKEFLKPIIFSYSVFSENVYFLSSKFLELADFHFSNFSEGAYFNSSTFIGETNFDSSNFLGDAQFSSTKFDEIAIFFASTFSKGAIFDCSIFLGDAYFRASSFLEDASFLRSIFSKDAEFTFSNFSGSVYFSSSAFSEDVFFHSASFSLQADFEDTEFYKRVEFNNAVFEDEVSFLNSKFSFLKNLETSGDGKLDFQGALLEECHFRDQKTFQNVSFQDAFLLSLNLRNKEIKECDFTGAVFAAVNTQGWKVDDATLEATKYIYTDYELIQEANEEGNQKTVYRAVESSRVPADGSFDKDFTFADYLKEPVKWSHTIPLLPHLSTEVQNYLNFFKEYLLTLDDIEVQLHARKEGKKIRLEFSTYNPDDKTKIEERLQEYIANLGRPHDDPHIHGLGNKELTQDVKFLIIRYENQIKTLQQEISYVKLLATKDSEHADDFKVLAQNLSSIAKGDVHIHSPNANAIATLEGKVEGTQSVDVHVDVDIKTINHFYNGLKEEIEEKAQETSDKETRKALLSLLKDFDFIKENPQQKPSEPLMKTILEKMKSTSSIFKESKVLYEHLQGFLTSLSPETQSLTEAILNLLKP